MKKILILSYVALLMLSCTPTESVIDLSGEWKVKIDSVQYKIMLPGSLAENKVGFQPKDSVTNILTETYSYQGVVYGKNKSFRSIYQRNIFGEPEQRVHSTYIYD